IPCSHQLLQENQQPEYKMKILSRFLNGNFELLEPYEGKLSSTVLRGESGSNAADLLDNLSVTANFLRPQTGVKKVN
ncbi:MAG TPA: hypothetical protein VIK55_19855, partial [Paludibacter sp.]